jgi:hypothetical protein
MQVSTGIYMHLSVDADDAYTDRCFFPFPSLLGSIYIYMLFKGCSRNISILRKPKLLFRIPPSARSFCLFPGRHVVYCNAQGDKFVHGISRGRRRPFFSVHDQLHCLQPLACFCVIAETDAQECVSVLLYQPFRSPLSGLEDQSCFHFLFLPPISR